MKRSKGFTLIELLIVLIIIAIIAVVAFTKYQGFVETAKCTGNAEQHRKVVALAESYYNFCRIDGSTYSNVRGSGCRSQRSSGMTAIGFDGTGKCIRKWDCKSQWAGLPVNAGQSSGHFISHAQAEFNTPNNTSGFIRNNQWQNFEKPKGPERPGITNIRGYPTEQAPGAQMRIATFLGSDCKGGNFSNSGGDYLINNITWP